ncbi:MAG: hypothetical protein NT080_01070 [Spirochaetes bacterium]|nr:hypothetical protein [Spirochaetota bacterium]
MKIKPSFAQLVEHSLCESFSGDMLLRLARDFFPGYDIHERTGFSPQLAVQPLDAAHRILEDILDDNRFIDLVERLIEIERNGFMGKPYPIVRLVELVRAVIAEGYDFDSNTGSFFENQNIRTTPTWGRLRPGEERSLAVYRMDIAGNSVIVREKGEKAAAKAFESLARIVSSEIEKRRGRIWLREGDGIVAAFMFGHPVTMAVLAGIAILNDLVVFNRFENDLGLPIRIRSAVHVGPLAYYETRDLVLKQETVREAIELEMRMTPVGSLSISPAALPTIDRVLAELFVAGSGPDIGTLSHYKPDGETR